MAPEPPPALWLESDAVGTVVVRAPLAACEDMNEAVPAVSRCGSGGGGADVAPAAVDDVVAAAAAAAEEEDDDEEEPALCAWRST